MDDLDRLAFRLVRTIRQHYPQLREHGFSLTDLEERLLPFRESRREMADGGADAWERTVLRLVGGERGYVHAEGELQRACHNALALPSPTLALVRSWSGASLALGEAAISVGMERVSGAFDAAQLSSESMQGRRGEASVSAAATTTTNRAGLRVEVLSDGASAARSRGSDGKGCGCRFCGGRLPQDRRVTFCPHCGLDQTKRQCPACSTELDAAWRFCVTCGRSAELPDTPASAPLAKRAAS